MTWLNKLSFVDDDLTNDVLLSSSFRIDIIDESHEWLVGSIALHACVWAQQDITHEWWQISFMKSTRHHSWVMSWLNKTSLMNDHIMNVAQQDIIQNRYHWWITWMVSILNDRSCDSSMMSILNDELNKTSFVRSSSTNDNLLSHVIYEWDLSSFMNDVLLSHIHVIHQWDLFDELNDELNKTSFMNDYVAQQDVGWWGGFG